MTRVAILDFDAGNLTSVETAVRHLGGDCVVTHDPSRIRDADRLIFPGVGAAGAAMESLRRLGLDGEIRAAHSAGKPILGICIGCQVIFSDSEEDGGTQCLGLLPGSVTRFRFPGGVERKIPHMGWNRVDFLADEGARHPVFGGIEPGSEFYFVHSYYPVPGEAADTQGTAVYGEVSFTAAVARENLAAVQFHAEKSGRCGLAILKNFLEWNP